MNKIKRGVYYPQRGEHLNVKDAMMKLKAIMEEEDLKIARYCCHKDEDAALMAMIIVVKDRYEYPIHRHRWKDESYYIIEGQCSFEEYSKGGIKEKKIKLGTGDFYYNNNRGFHCLRPETNSLCYIEHTVGPFGAKKLEYL